MIEPMFIKMLNSVLVVAGVLWGQEKDKRILIVGDSLTAGYGVSKEAAYPAQLEELLKKDHPDVKVIGAGSSGSTSASAISRLKWHLKAKPTHLILALGANDGLRGVKLESTKKNLSEAIDMAKDKKIKVYLAGMLLPTNYGEKYRSKFKSLFAELAKEKKVEFIPFLLKGVGGQPELNLADGIHPNEKGHKIVAKTVFDALKGDL